MLECESQRSSEFPNLANTTRTVIDRLTIMGNQRSNEITLERSALEGPQPLDLPGYPFELQSGAMHQLEE